MKIILLSLLMTLTACGPKKTTKYVVPHIDDITSSSQRWEKSKFPIKIRIPCIKDSSDANYPQINCNDQINSTRSNFVMYPADESNSNLVIEALLNSVATWNTALGATVLELEFVGPNVVYSDTPISYLSGNETSFMRLAFLTDWFSSMPAGEFKPSDNVLAITIYKKDENQVFLDADILFNVKRFSYIVDPARQSAQTYCATTHVGNQNSCDADPRCMWSGSTCYSSNMDFQSVLTHELGHFLGLGHVATVTDSSSIMNTSVSSEQKKRTLSAKDKCMINRRYRDIFATCDLTTAENKFCYDVTNVEAVGIVDGKCQITACKAGFTKNTDAENIDKDGIRCE